MLEGFEPGPNPIPAGGTDERSRTLPIRRFLTFLPLAFGFWAVGTSARAQDDVVLGTSPASKENHASKDVLSSEQLELQKAARELQELGESQAQPKGGQESEIERLKAQLQIQQKQIDVLLRMTKLLAGEVKKQPAATADSEDIEDRLATQEAALAKGVLRDQELARGVDQLSEQLDRTTTQEPAALDAPRALQPDQEQPIAAVDLWIGRSRIQRFQWTEQHFPRSNPGAPPLPAP